MIIVRLRGGMGNQMFQYALGRALASKYNVPLKLDAREYKKNFYSVKRKYTLDLFDTKAELATKKEIFLGQLFYKKGKEKHFHFDPKMLLLGPNVWFDGYWQTPKYFNAIETTIRKDFTFKNPFSSDVKDLMETIKNQESVCIHVRRGDYVGNKHHEVVNKEYYDRGLEYLKNKTKIDKIYVFSDDIKWCQENMKFEFPTMFVGEEYAGERAEGHLALMSTCHHFLIPNSSFSWWAAWLAEFNTKIVLVPKQWFTDISINTEDLIPNKWIKI